MRHRRGKSAYSFVPWVHLPWVRARRLFPGGPGPSNEARLTKMRVQSIVPAVDAAGIWFDRNMGEPWVVLDLSSRQDFRRKHIPDSIHAPLDELEDYELRLRLYAEGRNVAFVTRGDQSPRVAALELARLGLPSAHHLEGGIDSWSAAGFELESDLGGQAHAWLVGVTLLLLWLVGALLEPAILIVAASLSGALLGLVLLDQFRRGRFLPRLPAVRLPRLA